MRKEFLSGILSIIKTLLWKKKKKAQQTWRVLGEVKMLKHNPHFPLPATWIIKSGLKKFLLNI